MIQTEIVGIGGYVPEKAVTNFEIESLLDTTDEWIQQRTGIQQRHWLQDTSLANSDLGLKASLQALQHAQVSASDLDMIIYATSSSDYDVPGTACILQTKLGLKPIPALDIRQACSGFIYGLDIAEKFIRSGQCKTILLVGSELQSKGLDKTPRGRNISVLFGDGAGAVVLKAREESSPSRIFATQTFSDGKFASELWMRSPGSANGESRISHQHIEEGLVYPEMNGKTVFMHAVTRMPEVLKSTCDQAKIAVQDLDILFFHQANLRINSKVAEIMNLPESKIHNTIQKYGNTTAATIPLGMSDAISCGKLQKGMLVGIAAFGAGFTWGASVFRY
jgi:3-oxoacyl-[acyl-carrier-protein] synthase-3